MTIQTKQTFMDEVKCLTGDSLLAAAFWHLEYLLVHIISIGQYKLVPLGSRRHLRAETHNLFLYIPIKAWYTTVYGLTIPPRNRDCCYL